MKIYKLFLAQALLLVFSIACLSQNKSIMEKDKTSGNGKIIITAPIVSKNFVMKNAYETSTKELYVRRSTKDYFIKFCESKVSKKEFQEYLENIERKIKTLTLEVEIKEGNWDICDTDYEQQSRIGEYIIIHEVII